MLTVGDRFEAVAVDLDYKGQGVAKPEGYVIFIPGLLKDEKAVVELIRLNKKFGEAKIVRMLVISSKRCHDTSHLGSIELYHLDPLEQIKWQEKTTKETLYKIAHIEHELEKTITDEKYDYYRNKSVFQVLDDDTLKLGVYTNDFEIVEVPQFILSDDLTNKFLNMINRAHWPIEKNAIRHVVFRTNTKNEILITFVAVKEDINHLDYIVEKLATEKAVVGITLNIKDDENHILGTNSMTLYGKNEIQEELNGFSVSINDRSFFQVNFPVMRKVFQMIANDLNDNQKIVEAYSGIGTIGYFIYPKARRIVMIESNHENIEMAKKVIENERFNRIELLEAKAEEVIEEHGGDILVVDPPRNGLMKNFLNKVMEMDFKKIYYVSCDIKTLSRDLNTLLEKYQIEKIYPIRMFHHTLSIETLIILKK